MILNYISLYVSKLSVNQISFLVGNLIDWLMKLAVGTFGSQLCYVEK